jgi:acetyl-CoA C-acetyltransferase
MGVTAENIAKRYDITREEQEAFALRSQEKALAAVDAGIFDPEIVPIEIKTKKETIIFSRDEYPNRTTNQEKMAKLRPAFLPDGTVTAATSSGINDGASFVIVASEEAVQKYHLPVLAEVYSVGQGGVDPAIMGLGPIPAVRQSLKRVNMTLNQMQVIELNEAFAATSLGVIHDLAEEHKVDKAELMKKINVHGGAVALGHPVGNSGNRIVVTLLHEMIRQDQSFGLASLCIGGGMGTAIILRRTK